MHTTARPAPAGPPAPPLSPRDSAAVKGPFETLSVPNGPFRALLSEPASACPEGHLRDGECREGHLRGIRRRAVAVRVGDF